VSRYGTQRTRGSTSTLLSSVNTESAQCFLSDLLWVAFTRLGDFDDFPCKYLAQAVGAAADVQDAQGVFIRGAHYGDFVRPKYRHINKAMD
jgi:hypothetical protein